MSDLRITADRFCPDCSAEHDVADDAVADPIFYQGPSILHDQPLQNTHVGMTEDAARLTGFSPNFAGWAADRDAQTDYLEYDNDAAHAFDGSRAATLDRAQELGARVDAAVDRYKAATDAAARQTAAQDIATEFGRYLHVVQDNWAHGGVNAAQHYGQKVDVNPASIAAAQRESRRCFAEFGAYLESRGVDPAGIDPGERPGYSSPYWSGFKDWSTAPGWDGVDRMWNRDEMAGAIRDRFSQATRMSAPPSDLGRP
jgi:hypothetical protein